MHTSIAHTPRVAGRPAAEAEAANLRGLLATVRDALDLPYNQRRDAVLGRRVLLVLGVLGDVLDGIVPPQLLAFETDELRRALAKDGAQCPSR
jgi:hypothetical protein